MAFSTDFRNIINTAEVNARGFVDLAKTQLTSSQESIRSIGYAPPQWTDVESTDAPNVDALPQTPKLSPITLNLPPEPDQPPDPRQATPILDGQSMPVSKLAAPTLQTPNKPSGIGAAPLAPPINTSFAFPEPPAQLSNGLPQAPTFATRTEPTAPQIILPSFEAERPLHTADAPTDAAGQMQASYISTLLSSRANADAYVSAWIDRENPAHRAQLARLEAELERYLRGGTGIKEEVQDAIINRAREKQSRDAEATRLAAYSEAASRGFTLPSGALMSAVARARQEASNNVSKAITDLAVAQMEMEQRNLQFAVTTSANLRQTMVSASLNYMGQIVSLNSQAMDYAKSVFANVVELYNASVRVFSARVDAYRTYAAVHEAQIKAAMAKLEVYQAEIEALKALTDVDQTRASIYKIQVDAITSVIALYRAQIEAVQGRASLEKLKLEIFQTQTQAYGTQVQAKNAEWSAYNAELAGEESKIRMYNAQLAGFNAELDAYRAKIAAKTAESDAVIRENAAQTDRYQAMVQTYTARVNAESARAQAENDNNRQIITAFNAEMAGFELKTRVDLARYSTEAEVNIKNATGNLQGQVESSKGNLEYGKTLSDLSLQIGKIYSALGSAAMSGINTLVAGNEDA